jgi:3'-phosphoadenosine 5'-phosphosulfate (PAPS) 3'-phosphatase
MSWVAQGKFTAYVSWDLNAWDVAAGMVAVEEAGGFVANFDGKRATIKDRDLIVTCKEEGGRNFVNYQVQKVLEENDCTWYWLEAVNSILSAAVLCHAMVKFNIK